MEHFEKMIWFFAGSGIYVVSIVLLFLGKRIFQDEIIERIGKQGHFGEKFFCTGYALLELLRIRFSSEKNRERISKMASIRDAKTAILYLKYIYSGIISYCLFLIPLGFMFAILAENTAAGFVIGPLMAFAFSYMLWNHYDNLRIEKRDLTEGELPTVVSKMLLLIHSGMTLNDAWNLVAREGHGVIYDEMKITYREIKMEGVPEKKAYEGFAERCGSVKITSFVSMITQNLQKGSADLVKYMEEMLQEIWQNKEALIQRKVTRVSDLLMYPSLLIFVGILMMILIPIFMQFSTLL